MRRKRRNMHVYADGITLLHLGVVEHSVLRASGCSSQYCKARVRMPSAGQAASTKQLGASKTNTLKYSNGTQMVD